MGLHKSCITDETKDSKVCNLSSIAVKSKDVAPTKLTINNWSEFPAKGLPHTLKSLYIEGLKLCSFRQDILLLNHLTLLNLSNNEIEKIPPEFGNLPSLRELYLSNNSLGSNKNPNWQWLLGIQVSKNLKVLDLCGNKLQDLPKSIWKLQNLITLKLDNNNLNKLPSSLGRISTLRYLSVSKNNLQYIPYSLKHCGLEHLDISLNDFTPEETGLQQYGTQWEFYNSLVHIAAKTVLENKLSYAPNILPETLVELLDNSNICICGKPVLDDKCLIKKTRFNEFSSITFILVKDFFTVQCFICSPKCHYYFRVIRIYNLILNT